MSHQEQLKQEALGSFGVVTFATARKLGIGPGEFYRWVNAGRLVKTGRGVYRFADYPMVGSAGEYTAILAEVGRDAYLCGESVLGFLELCPVRSYVATVASPHRLRKKLSAGVMVFRGAADWLYADEHGGIGNVPASPLEAREEADLCVRRGLLFPPDPYVLPEDRELFLKLATRGGGQAKGKRI